ncbi:PREDICTED: fibrous sheath-interacting protein 2-like isoform X2 [Chinchilla lanigera]|uniref:fibrous sheath-interacting protein 2-like isoform X2 n=1 Tax=Chinchilla lanigera TaxID=34839 RepID=UPI00038E98AA|nr:PREDICTED: fibrous sheath-interacting protein 2-like isoform X2 [Chinchilla lanigera]
MDLYFRKCCKASKAAAAKAPTNSLNSEKKRSTSPQKHPVPEIGAADLLDLPLGVKVPVSPGSTNIFYTTNISEKLHQPSLGFSLTDPYCQLLETTYKSLHDPHLKTYYQRKDILRRLRRGGFITSDNKVVCTLSEFNKYRQYLTSLKIDFEREYLKEHSTMKTHVNKLRDSQKVCNKCDAAKFQEWLLQNRKQTTPEQELIIKRRYLDMIRKKVNKIEDTTEDQRMLPMKKEKRLYEDYIRRKINLCGPFEEEWKNKEILLLRKIGEEAERDWKVEQCRKIREGIAQKKQAYLEKKIAYHLQKVQRNDHEEESEGSAFTNKGQDKTGSFHIPKINNKICAQKLSTSLPSKQYVQNNATKQKKHKETTRTSDPFKNIGMKNAFINFEAVTSQTSVPRQCLPNISEQATKKTSFLPDVDRTKKVICAGLNGKKTKKSSYSHESAQRIEPSRDSSHKHQTYYHHHCQEKAAKPGTTKAELLKDAQNRKDRLVPPDTDQKESENKVQVKYISDEDKVVLPEVVKEGFPGGPFKASVRKEKKHTASMLTSPKSPVSKSTLNNPSLSECFYPESSTAKSTETIRSQWTESDVHTCTSKSVTCTDSSLKEKRTRSSVEEMRSATEPLSFIWQQIMSSSSKNEEDSLLYFSDDRVSDPSAKITEDSLTDLDPDSSSVKFTTLFQRESVFDAKRCSDDKISEEKKEGSDLPEVAQPENDRAEPQITQEGSQTLNKVLK